MMYGGFHWPDDDVTARPVIMREAETAIPAFLAHVPGRSSVIQAGGNVGVYPKLLREHFAHVLTVEPDRTNYRCMMQNIGGDIDVRLAAFGEAPEQCSVRVVTQGNCGAHRVEAREDGDVPILTIDSFGLKPDAIWLDIEGFELFALRGAIETLKRCKPVVVLEEKGLGEAYGLRPEDCGQFLADMGYSRVDRIGNDNVYRVEA